MKKVKRNPYRIFPKQSSESRNFTDRDQLLIALNISCASATTAPLLPRLFPCRSRLQIAMAKIGMKLTARKSTGGRARRIKLVPVPGTQLLGLVSRSTSRSPNASATATPPPASALNSPSAVVIDVDMDDVNLGEEGDEDSKQATITDHVSSIIFRHGWHTLKNPLVVCIVFRWERSSHRLW